LEPIGNRARAAETGVARDDRVVGVEDERACWIDELGKAALHASVGGQIPMSIEMIGGHVRVDGDGRPARQRRQLELGELEHDPILRAELRQSLHDGAAHVPAEDRAVGRVGREDRMGQGRRRRLTFRPTDPDRRRRAQPQEEVRLPDHGRDR